MNSLSIGLGLFYTVILFVSVQEVECEVKQIHFCPGESATIYCNVTSNFAKLYWKNSTDYVVASQTFDKRKTKTNSQHGTYSSSDRFDVQQVSLKISFPKDGEQFYCDVVSRKKEKKQYFTLVEYSKPFSNDVCSSPKDLESRQPRSSGNRIITREINETAFVCISGRTVLKCDDGQHDTPIAEYWKDKDGKVIVSNVDGRLSNTSDARYIFNRMNSTLLIQNVTKSDYQFVCETVYKDKKFIKRFDLLEYDTPEDNFFEGFRNKECEVDTNENGKVNLAFSVASFSPMDAVTVNCELNGECIKTNKQYSITDDGNFHLQIFIDVNIELSQNLTCRMSGPAMCNHNQEFVCYLKFKEILQSSSPKKGLVIGLLGVFVVVGVCVAVGCICCYQKQEDHNRTK